MCVVRTPLTDVTRRSSNAETLAGWRHSVPSWIGGAASSIEAFETSPCECEPDLAIPYIDDASPVMRATVPNVASPLPDVVCNGSQFTACNELDNHSQGDAHVWLDVVLVRLK